MSIETKTQVSNETLDNFDDFLEMPGADSIVTPEQNVFTKTGDELNFLNPGEEKTEDADEIAKNTLKELDDQLNEDIVTEQNEPGRKKTDKSGLVETFSKLIEDGLIIPFDEDKPIEEYSVKDFKELISANFEERERQLREQTPKEFFEALPQELQYAAKYVADGGQDLKGLFSALAQVEQVRDLDPAVDEDQEVIARNYLYATNYRKGNREAIEEQIEEWKEAGTLTKKARQFKPELDEMQQEIVQSQLKQQEEFKKQQLAIREGFMENVYNTLKKGEISGVKIDSKQQQKLWEGLTTLNYPSRSGKQTNLLGHLLEEYQFGKEPRYDLIAEATWLLSDPDGYKQKILEKASTAVAGETARKLKTEQSNKQSSTIIEEPETKTAKRVIPRQRNIFTK